MKNIMEISCSVIGYMGNVLIRDYHPIMDPLIYTVHMAQLPFQPRHIPFLTHLFPKRIILFAVWDIQEMVGKDLILYSHFIKNKNKSSLNFFKTKNITSLASFP
nr:hypothetical protein Itr_chr05CG05320 [Ipomoea trifida]